VVESERRPLIQQRDAAADIRTMAETQVSAIDHFLTRYQILSEQYTSDLSRLNFVSEVTPSPHRSLIQPFMKMLSSAHHYN